MSSKQSRKPNIVVALRNRSSGCTQRKFTQGPLKAFAEKCAATLSSKNRKVELPARTRTTFMTAFSPDNRLIASCHGDHNIYISNISTGKVENSLVGHSRSPWCLSFHPSSNDIIATGCLNGEVRVWDLRGGGSESWMVSENEAMVTIASLSFHPTDHVLLIAAGNEIHFWDWSLPQPFASVKTGSAAERVRLVRFDMWGTNILTGVVNFEEEQNSGTDEEENESVENPVSSWNQPSSIGDSLTRRRQLLRSWMRGRPRTPVSVENDETVEPREIPLPSNPVRRAPIPLYIRRRQAGGRSNSPSVYNLRSRDRRSVATDFPDTEQLETSRPETNTSEETEPQERFLSLRLHSLNRLFELRQRMSDLSNSRAVDHQRILHARVSVNAEIQHQYNRLRLLRQERRRLELRLQQLQGRSSQSNSSPVQPTVVPSEAPLLNNPAADIVPIFSELHPHTDPEHNDLSTESVTENISTEFNSHSRPRNLLTPSRTNVAEESIPGNLVVPINPEIPVYLSPMEETPATNPSPSPSRNRTIPSYFPTLSNSTSSTYRSSGSSRRTTQPPFYFVPGTQGPDLELSQDFTFSRTPNQRLRLRQSRAIWRRHRRRFHASNINQILSLHPQGHVDRFSYRLQWWDFSKLALPEIGRSDTNVIVPHCKIYNDSSVDISKDGTKLATFIPTEVGFPESMQVAVYSLLPDTLGEVLFRKPFGPHAVCLSLSPLGDYLAVGVKNRPYLPEALSTSRSPMAQILKLNKNGENNYSPVVNQIMHPINPDTPHRFVSINTVAWLPNIGDGLLYGTNNGELRICQPAS
uniref:activating molecule in BECN1-regulated autophagy protein 1 n=1 Tax=Ciona intestinalis TaxID=7719 RepID=UPI00006A403A|nr:activating molecule in BECN1-regulated autophagy protein 1 [Ciona intestinalis]|eukprot:XP_002128991.1 activating molecule in BECN1-regulated autophagy protein 1 [Ciona intestinalis]